MTSKDTRPARLQRLALHIGQNETTKQLLFIIAECLVDIAAARTAQLGPAELRPTPDPPSGD